MTTNVPQIVFSGSGITVPSEASILAGVQLDNNAAFGGNLNPALETPQGQLASSLTAIIADKDAQIAYITNQVDPTHSEGRFQDSIGKIYFLTRIPSAGTVVTAQVTGLSGTVIPIGATAKNTSTGEIYTCTTPTTLISGAGVAVFTNNNPGAIPCAANALNAIYQSISGWESITNSSAGVPGRSTETRAEFETRRRASVALNAVGYVQAIRANALQVPGVISAYVTDNHTSAPIVVGGVTIAANAVYVAAVGGNASDIAYAIWLKKSLGSPWAAGTNTVTVSDTSYPIPYPTYSVTFTIPTNIPIYFAVSISANVLLPNNINALIKQAIMDAFSGSDGGAPANIGYSVYAARFYYPIGNTDASCNVISVKVGTAPSPTSDFVTININQFPTVDDTHITITQV